ncbi:hypothetical protein FD02_GL000303 [Lacticaseibacillus nasuensis JCM 17158]|uniref:Uncharacterized protein n=1 Tax=Lacticaseibacillus nasuensis JCM 17158 TaxID=1291734 RepID=A0A0R1JIM6_9LACO|nr:hypothetical protein FD02_GL000303 [Lacticaseibacillus nasuensis JCM 17158]
MNVELTRFMKNLINKYSGCVLLYPLEPPVSVLVVKRQRKLTLLLFLGAKTK